MEKGQKFEVTIEDLSTEGQGIGRVFTDENSSDGDGLVVFVPETVPGDKALIELTKVKKNYAFSRLVNIISESPDRVDDPCSYGNSRMVKELSGRDDARPCGGCPFGKINYEAQLKLKQKQVKSKLERLAGIAFASEEKGEGAVFRNIIGMADEECFRYRNKAVMPVSTGGLMTRKGGIQEPVHEPRIGFRPSKSNDVIDCEDCRLQAPSVTAAAEATRRFMMEDNITSYDKRWDKGLMKAMTVRTAFGTGEVMVIYEINGKGIPNAAKLAEMLDDAVYEAGVELSGDEENPALSLESIVLKTVNSGKVKTETLIGKNTITDIVRLEGTGELEFEISAQSFYQVNPVQMQKLYGVVREFCSRSIGYENGIAYSNAETDVNRDVSTPEAADRRPVILDLYCGIGTIGLCLADMAKHVYGIELVKDAVTDANRNATINGIVNASYVCGRAEEIIPKWLNGNTNDAGYADNADDAGNLKIKEDSRLDDIYSADVTDTVKSVDIAVLDPPRAGCRPELLRAIAEAEIPNIIYVSCDPATLARDIRLLSEGMGDGCRYQLIEAVPVDMFPHTGHVEVCCVLVKK